MPSQNSNSGNSNSGSETLKLNNNNNNSNPINLNTVEPLNSDNDADSEINIDNTTILGDEKKEINSNSDVVLELKSLKAKSPEKLIEIAATYGVDNIGDLGKQDIIYYILKGFSDQNYNNIIIGEGVLEVLPDGFGFLRASEANYFPGSDDIYVSPSQIKRFGLTKGCQIKK